MTGAFEALLKAIKLARRSVPLLLLVLLPLAVQAQGGSKLPGYLFSIKSLYEALEYEQALGQIERAKRFAKTEEDDVTLSLYEGVIKADMNRWEESAAAFKAALYLDPEAKLPVQASPKVERHFETVRQEVRSEIATAKKKAASSTPQQETARSSTGTQPAKAGNTQGERKPTAEETSRTPLAADALPVVPPPSEERSRLRPQVLIPAIGGGVLMIAGGTSWMLSRRELSRLRSNEASLVTREDVRSSASRGRTYQNVGVGLLGAGLVGVGVATGLFFGTPSDELAFGMGSSGTSVVVRGRLP